MITKAIDNKSRRSALSRMALCEQICRRVLDHFCCEIEDLNYELSDPDLDHPFSSVIDRRWDRKALYGDWHKMAQLLEMARAITTALQISMDYLTVTNAQGRFLDAALSREPDKVETWLLEQLKAPSL